ncbi:hypothetical protein MPTK1_6g00190 [Marchantia polymorpha subsp. ruderalis]|nr:hypothetical protein MARPO_0163s0003 [Marchantia polymorpha]BBN13025.1 hypothetical protein Mp_6g00190 [Marchantia polymorpha subsp. ruderalis]|eukprot:PTQ28442.1 hypothetical protein MARPO_0163s0003 [Marchantia polymorpha]
MLSFGEMDPKIWSTLSEEIVIKILTYLPWDGILRLRAVCVEWNAFFRSEEFRQKWEGRDPNQLPLCFMGCKKKGNTVYNPASLKWQVCGVSISPMFYSFTDEDGVSYNTRDVRMMGAAHGLLLLKAVPPWNRRKFDLYVLNPMDPRTRKRIPLLPEMQDLSRSQPLGMAWNEETESHRILIQSESSNRRMWSFHSYDIRSSKWEQIARWPRDRLRFFQHPSMCGGRFLCLGSMGPIMEHDMFRAYRQDNSSTNWLQEPTWVGDDDEPSLPYPLHFATLFHLDEDIMVAGGRVKWEMVKHRRCKVLQDFCVWKLQTLKYSQDSEDMTLENEWIEVRRMPIFILEKLNRDNSQKQFLCAANKNYVCVANSWRDVALFDMMNHSWTMLPSHSPFESESYCSADPIFEGDLCDLHFVEPRFDISL